MTSDKTIEIWTPRTTGEQDGQTAALPKLGSAHGFEVSHVDPSVLIGNLGNFLRHFRDLPLDSDDNNGAAFSVQEIELNLGISGKGSIALIGKIEAGVEAGIKVKLLRKRDALPRR